MQSENKLLGLFTISLLIGLLAFVSQAQGELSATPQPTQSMGMMGSMDTDFSVEELVPLVRGIFEGEDIFFIHTETSDLNVSSLLTDMMVADVVTVPSLAEIPTEILGNVYVFTNGVTGAGPMGFQLDIFDSVPDDENYTPLRTLNLVTWQENSEPRQLDSVADIEAAQDNREIEIEQSGVVINMPILVWSDSHR